MKAFSAVLSSTLLVLLALAQHAAAQADPAGGRAIGKVVKLLTDMAAKSKADGEKDKELYKKFKCYCDDNIKTKTKEIAELQKEISVHAAKIEELKGKNAELAAERKKLARDIGANELVLKEAAELRQKENEDYKKNEADMTAALGQMQKALEVLSAIGADQTDGKASADTKKFMSGGKKAILLGLQESDVQDTLAAASAFLPEEHRKTVVSLLGAPMQGNHNVGSGPIVGILKNMKDTFTKNIADAKTTEEQQQAAHADLVKTKTEILVQLKKLAEEKKAQIASNEEAIVEHTKQSKQAVDRLAAETAFLEKLKPQCVQKEKEYKERSELRTKEDAAIEEAVAILDSGDAFKTFGNVKATRGAAFLQLAAVRRHSGATTQELGERVLRLLRRAATDSKGNRSLRLTTVAAMLVAQSPFDKVLEELKNMVALIQEEAKTDKNKKDWCLSERAANNAKVDKKTTELAALDQSIMGLVDLIQNAQTGLKAQIAATEKASKENSEAQATATKNRKSEKENFENNVADLSNAKALLGSATQVLKNYYDKLAASAPAKAALLEQDPAPPATWETEGGYKGQSEVGKGVLNLLADILSQTQKEEDAARAEEAKAQKAFEDSMKALTTEASTLQKNLVSLKAQLTAKKKELLDTRALAKTTKADKEAAQEYLLKIKESCDRAVDGFDGREQKRQAESQALSEADKLIKATPVFQNAAAAAAAKKKK